jgi:uncharacterized membrane protein YdfJ with MMPL/SSD domain
LKAVSLFRNPFCALAWTRAPRSRTTSRVAGLVASQPVLVALGAVAVLAVLGISALHYHPS